MSEEEIALWMEAVLDCAVDARKRQAPAELEFYRSWARAILDSLPTESKYIMNSGQVARQMVGRSRTSS